MKQGMKILVAYDGSGPAENALNEAIDLTRTYAGSITVLHVCYEESDEQSRAMLAAKEAALKRAGVEYELKSVRGLNTPARILSTANEGGYDLIVMGTRGMGHAHAWVMGSVSSRVVGDSLCPVLLAK